MFNKYLVSLYSFSSVSGVLGSLKVLAAFMSLLGNLKKKPDEMLRKLSLFVMVRDMRLNSSANSQGVVGNMSSKTTTEFSVWSQSASRSLSKLKGNI